MKIEKALVKKKLRALAVRVPPVARLQTDRDRWRARHKSERERAEGLARRVGKLEKAAAATARKNKPYLPAPGVEVAPYFQPGHFYSPIPDLADVRAREASIFGPSPSGLPGIDLRIEEQLALVPAFAKLYGDMPFEDEPVDGLRYGFQNRFYGAGSGVVLYSMLRHLAPARLVEVGSGWSSALTLDVNDRFLDGKLECTFVEPFPERLLSLLRPADHERVRLFDKPLHAVGPEPFAELAAGDVLFIDSTHVSRVGSDVNRLLLDVVPSLPSGVYVHVHDIFWPFEYPRQWIFQGRAWNELYLLHALLIDNPRLQIVWFNDYLYKHHFDAIAPHLPQWARGASSSIWLRTA